ncbi:DUF1499 domain-containing protein [Aggregicoccus sp. 17bor-14]|uniref:DUF1499 domain-containing protein n=1 Tax=Myxococcaceae TaxID=31 RepID=UPI00129C2432|nr:MULTISPECIES: DUF1499 domain-containing protein [Myxococcaceae]MBF5044442.1 DUF1499 domain-containing protein [Simulacricoccus sp. 17bor-14]MRI90188.1 DUF1499 domain-containing protein [Aggregicoccus sp. 17bor-14]
MFKSASVWVALLAVAALVLGPLLAHFGVVRPLQGLMSFGAAAALGLLAMVAGVVSVLRRRARQGALAIGLGMLCLLVVLLPAFAAGRIPPINDVSTDLESPPALTRAEPSGRSLAYPPDFVHFVRDSYADLRPLVLPEPADAVLARVEALARRQPGWTVVSCDPQARVCEGYAESRLFRFRDDFAIRVRAEGQGARVDMRSRSRDGKGDLGVNAARIRDFLGQLGGSAAQGSGTR